jgi:hypothetical protein
MPTLNNLQEIFGAFLAQGTVLSDEYTSLCCSDCLQPIPSPVPLLPLDGDISTTPIQPVDPDNFNVYVFCSALGFNDFMDKLGITSDDLNCCLHVNGSVPTIQSINIIDDIPNFYSNCSENFNICVNQLKNYLTPTDIYNINDVGIVEYGSISGQSQVCLIKEFVEYAYDNRDDLNVTKSDILTTILQDGIVITCFKNEMSISNLEQFGIWYNYIDPS